MILSGYQTIETVSIDSTRAFILYRGYKISDKGREPSLLLLKSTVEKPITSRAIRQFENEFRLARELDPALIVRPLRMEWAPETGILVMENFDGLPLHELSGSPMELRNFLKGAISIAKALDEIHKHKIIHKDINPGNILLNPETGEAKITGFGIASALPQEQLVLETPSLIEGTLEYMSPEQTGRMNRTLDYRTDFYSLGVTFYEMLAGRLPLSAKDPLGWVYAQIARMPIPLHRLIPGIPPTVSEVVQKLLGKGAEERYQSANGLRLDLEKCLRQLDEKGEIEEFDLDEHDLSVRFQIPHKLYGRKREVAELLQCFERVMAGGHTELALISGYSGIGKTALINELDIPIVRERGFFVSGKFDPFKKNIPYSALVEAFQKLVRGILSEGESDVLKWREELLEALEDNAQLIIDVIPQIKLIIGPAPPMMELPLTQAEIRLKRVFLRFIGVFAQKEHPLALFLDDLQWADSASLGLLQELLVQEEVRYLLVLGAYRSNEVDRSHPLMQVLESARARESSIREIVLGPLSQRDLFEFVSDIMRTTERVALQMTMLVAEKTAGNPFFIIQFLTSLFKEGLYELDQGGRILNWDMEKIRKRKFTDNVVDLMLDRLKRLPEETQSALKVAACIGGRFEIRTLARIFSQSDDEILNLLWMPIEEELLLRTGTNISFVHDRIQQAAHELNPEAERTRCHLLVGRTLLAQTPEQEVEKRVFEIVNQLNLGSVLISNGAERRKLAELNLLAARKSKVASAYASTVAYSSEGMKLLAKDGPDRDHELSSGLYFERATGEFLIGNLGKSRELLTLLFGMARSRLEKAAIYSLQLAVLETMGEFEEAVKSATECVKMFNIDLAPHPTREQITQEYERVWKNLGQRKISDLIDLPPMTDPDIGAVLLVLAGAYALSSYYDLNLFIMVSCLSVNLCIQYGNSEGSPMSYGGLGIVMGPEFGKWQEAYEFGKLAYDLMEKKRSPLKSKLCVVFGGLIYPWTRSIRTAMPFYQSGFEAGLETGDVVYASYNLLLTMANRLILGEPLEAVYRESERLMDFVVKTRISWMKDMVLACQLLIRDLRGEALNEESFEKKIAESGIGISISWALTWRLQARFMSGDYSRAIELGRKIKVVLWTTIGRPPVFEFHYYDALARAAQFNQSSDEEKKEMLEVMREHLDCFKEWERNSPENFRNKAALIAAELARVENKDTEAMRLYENAVRLAREDGFVQNEGIANELAARFYVARGFQTIADAYLSQAYSCYVRWGADGQVKRLERRFPQLQRVSGGASILITSPEQIDLMTVIQASHAISSEIVLSDLLKTLVRTSLTQAGAEKGFVVLPRKRGFAIRARAKAIESKEIEVVLEDTRPTGGDADTEALCWSIVNYVASTREKLVLENAAESAMFSQDRHVKDRQIKSVLCLPILRQAKLVGILYLENNLLTGAFTSDKLAVLELVGAQAAISLENATLLQQERKARAEIQGAQRRALFLAEASKSLASSLDYKETLQHAAQLAVPEFSESCTIFLSREGDSIDPVAMAHSEPQSGVSDPIGVMDVVRTGESGVFREIERSKSAIVVPLTSRGAILGAASFFLVSGKRFFTRKDLALFEELGRRIANAVDSARLYGEAQKSIQVRDDFLAVASHELRTPLAPIQINLRTLKLLLGNILPDARMASVLKSLDFAVERLIKLVENLLDVSRISANRLTLNREEVDLALLVNGVVETLRPQFARVQCEVKTDLEASVIVYADRLRLEQVLANLFVNAMRYGAGKPVEVTLTTQIDKALLSVRDYGIGIDKSDLKKIFGRFERASPLEHYGGLGLGLYVSHEIVVAHGGAIRVKSEPGSGSVFFIELPLTCL